MKKIIILFSISSILYACNSEKKSGNEKNAVLVEKLKQDSTMILVKQKAIEIIKKGFNAGDGYSEVWIRDYNTFIDLSAEVFDAKILEENLLVFFKLQG
ncbi:MAG: hypothetical protein OEW87_09570, partial [Flavobacteriaceae bacterium]|nr:hypothetical protein [Flavobacteriaceae bacterium]